MKEEWNEEQGLNDYDEPCERQQLDESISSRIENSSYETGSVMRLRQSDYYRRTSYSLWG